MVKASIVGATGYTGEEIVKILTRHKSAKIVSLTAKIEQEVFIDDEFPELKHVTHIKCYPFEKEIAAADADVVFLALPHTVSMKFASFFLKQGKKVIDLSADYRLKNAADYEKWYGCKHVDEDNVQKAVYGLPELYENDIRSANLIANPGCYPTSVILGLAPLLKNNINSSDNFIVDSKTGIMGAGRKASLSFHFPECDGSVWAYKIGQHQHTPEMIQELARISGRKTSVLFTPHVVPSSRGILSTIYADVKKGIKLKEIIDIYADFYGKSPFVRVYPEKQLPHTKDISANNFCDIGFGYDSESGKLIVVSTVDNLLKGAAGQAVQNMNIIYGFDQKEGLI